MPLNFVDEVLNRLFQLKIVPIASFESFHPLAIISPAQVQVDPNSPFSVRNLVEAQEESEAYQVLLEKLSKGGFQARPVNNFGISKEEFLQKIESILVGK